MDSGFLNWLAGFIDGEGSFTIEKWKHGKLRVRFQLVLRDDDGAILCEIVRKTGLGRLGHQAKRDSSSRNRNPQARWTISAIGECEALRDILSNHPLRAKKRRDFHIWSLALGAQRRGDQAELRSLREHLQRIRAYPGSSTV